MQDSSMLFPIAMDADDGHRPSSPPSSSSSLTVNLVSPVRQQDTTVFQPPAADDLDIMLLHEDLPELLRLAARLQEATTTSSSTLAVSSATNNAPIVVERMQQALLSQPGDIIRRGRYPMVDATLQDAMDQLEEARQALMAAPKANPPSAAAEANKTGHKRKPSDTPIAVKYAKSQTDVLMQWMIDHQDNPFPTTQNLDELSRTTGLSKTQVNNWATNVRKRNLKATCENGKKPHHFIDFLFHRRDREAKATKEQQPSRGDMTSDTFRGSSGGGFVSMMHQHRHPPQQQLLNGPRQLSSSSSCRPQHVVDLTQEPTHRRSPSFIATNAIAPSWSIKSVFDEVDAEMFGPLPDRLEATQQRQSVPVQLHESFQTTYAFDDEPYTLEQQQTSPGDNVTTSVALERLHSDSIESLDDTELDKLVKELDRMNDIA